MAALFCYLASLLVRPNKLQHSNREVSKYKLKQPRTPHLTLQEEHINNRDIFIIGDVHGCLDELNDLLQLAKAEANDRQILPIFVGDLANKGPYNVESIRRVRKMDALVVRGNHDEAVIRNFLNHKENSENEIPTDFTWVKGLETEDIEYLLELPYTISIPSRKAVVVHAGLVPGVQLERQNLNDFILMRNLYQHNGKLVASEFPFQGKAWASQWSGPEHIYFGHDASRKLQQYPYATGLDTGCLYGFCLTGIFLDSKIILQVKAKEVYLEPRPIVNK